MAEIVTNATHLRKWVHCRWQTRRSLESSVLSASAEAGYVLFRMN